MKNTININQDNINDWKGYSMKLCDLFNSAIEHYHQSDDIDTDMDNPYQPGSEDSVFYEKSWTDIVQWHIEDLIRDPEIDPEACVFYKRRIDKLNQKRTDIVEQIDMLYYAKFYGTITDEGAGYNTETPAWAIDRLSILMLKIFHMQIEVSRFTPGSNHEMMCSEKLNVLTLQKRILTQSIDELLASIEKGTKRMIVYKQMKMYNDENLNPVFYNKPIL